MKKWKAGVKYTFKDREGFIASNSQNKELAHLLSDEFTPLEIDSAGDFALVQTLYSELVELPYYVVSLERKFFKRVK